MPTSSMIAPHLPYLRRFARALAGSQTGGDAYALSTLQALAADPSLIEDDQDIRVGLYHLLLRIWATVPVNEIAAGPTFDPSGEIGRRSLETLAPRPRIAFLLVAVEGFSEAQVAAALDCSVEEARSLIEAARSEIADQMATDVLIIEDEPIIAMDLETLVEGQGHRVIGVAATHGEAIDIVRHQRPGLVLADIQLADGSSGLDAVNEILRSFEVPVIFVTAYPEQLLTGERPEPAFLITKPFRIETLKAIMSQALFFTGTAARPAASQ
jgi:CheY-like chemotaxis protein